MIKHMVAFHFKEDLQEPEKESLLSELGEMLGRSTFVSNFCIGKNVGPDARFSHAFFAEFPGLDLLRRYLDDEDHRIFVKKKFLPSVSGHAVISLEQ